MPVFKKDPATGNFERLEIPEAWAKKMYDNLVSERECAIQETTKPNLLSAEQTEQLINQLHAAAQTIQSRKNFKNALTFFAEPRRSSSGSRNAVAATYGEIASGARGAGILLGLGVIAVKTVPYVCDAAVWAASHPLTILSASTALGLVLVATAKAAIKIIEKPHLIISETSVQLRSDDKLRYQWTANARQAAWSEFKFTPEYPEVPALRRRGPNEMTT